MDLSTIICWVLGAAACYWLADYKNRDTTHWAIMGLLFTVFAFVWLLFLPKIEKESETVVDSVEDK